jgi:2',3'-cyclic-nucleotide 2'-phosphodiesterase (5'-nucleotidase family)
VVLLFAGDLLQGTLTSSLFLGVPNLVLFDRLGVDTAVVGNHELDYGQDVFRRLVGLAGFPFLTANVQTHPEPLPVRPSVVIAKPGGPRVAILGLTTPDLTTAMHPRNVYGVVEAFRAGGPLPTVWTRFFRVRPHRGGHTSPATP